MSHGDASLTRAANAATTLADAFRNADASPEGLSSTEAAKRLAVSGPNLMRDEGEAHPVALLFGQFRSPLIIILVAAAVLTFALGEPTEAAIILTIVVASTALGFYQEFRASSAMQALRRRLAITAVVIRDGRELTVPAAQLVHGDIALLSGGSLVPADGIVIAADELQVDEAALTGESFPVSKNAARNTLAETNRLHLGTSARSGTGRMLVTATGQHTTFAAVAGGVAKLEPESDFSRGIRRFGLLMTQVMAVMLALILPVNLILGRPLLESLLFSAALAVGLTPELLPAIVSVTLSRGAKRLADAGVLVRRLVAIENLGAIDVLCTDKTGTLTEGTIRMTGSCDPQGTASSEALMWGGLNAVLRSGLPNPMDTAVGQTLPPSSVSGWKKLGEVPYDFERKRLSVLVAGKGRTVFVCKGAVSSVLPLCTLVATATGETPMTPGLYSDAEKRLTAWGAEGIRVLAVAIREGGSATSCSRDDERGLTLVGYLVFADPPKPGLRAVIANLKRKGVALKIVTGDNAQVARHVAAEVGLTDIQILTGAQLATLTDRALARRARGIAVFAEVTPDQKERIVAALRRTRHVVGYLGDGINDAPALRAADVGISIDGAVDAAREAADVVLLRRDLNVLLEGILIGRRAFANTLKYITITTSANFGNMISMAVASLFLPFLPLLAKQILVNNLMSDLPMLAISADRVDEEVLDRPGRWDLKGLVRSMLAFGLLSSAFDGLTFLLLIWLAAGEAEFQTTWFVVSLLTEVAVVAVMRTRKPFYRSAPSQLLIGISLAVGVAAVALPFIPNLAQSLSFVPLPVHLLLVVPAIVAAYVVASEILKRIRFHSIRRRRGK